MAAFQGQIEEREAAVADREGRLALLDDEYRSFRDAARAREDDLSHELQDRLQQIGSLQGDIEAAGAALVEREAVLQGELARREAELSAQLDRQGRVLIPAKLREMAALDGAVLVSGRGECLEIWNLQRWQETDARLRQRRSTQTPSEDTR